MTVQPDGLAELLARAAEVEVEWKDDDGSAHTLTPDAIEDLAAQAAQDVVGDVAAEVEALRDQVFALQASAAPGQDAQADLEAADDDEPSGMDYDEPDAVEGSAADAPYDPTLAPQEKADGYGPCPECASTGVDVFDDGRVWCEDCGLPRTKRDEKGWDFEEPDDE